jgi:hypothetical protein
VQGAREVPQFAPMPEHHQLHYYPYPVAHLPSSVAMSTAAAVSSTVVPEVHLPAHGTARLASGPSRMHVSVRYSTIALLLHDSVLADVMQLVI